ncbi:lipase 1 isoform X2 [Tetranychus urticae]|uniref:lipase 1 isoform X2 n=1 Tax=Tetranychus urticae TaxID=32264 RepID=UPI00077BA50B|nr:lipase 1 isoform X2 [Tetranychus urticae]
MFAFNFHFTTADPDDTVDAAEIIESRGFKSEVHTIVTQDGYILTNFRIVHPLSKNINSKPILLQSGLFGSGDDFIVTSPNGFLDESMINLRDSPESIDYKRQGSNLGFLLANLGYDVWLTNFRGNYYSRNHTKFDPDSSEFWSTNFDEMATIDLPTIIDYVLDETKKETVGYIGVSRGGTTMFALLSDKPEYADKVKPFIALAPAVFIGRSYPRWVRPFIENNFLTSLLLDHPSECLPRRISKRLRSWTKIPMVNAIFAMIKPSLNLIFRVNESRAEVYLSHYPAGAPCWDIVHYGQFASNGFRKLDFGEKLNLVKYGTSEPPEYHLGKIRSNDIVIINSVGDRIVHPDNIVKLVNNLNVKPKKWIVINQTDFRHGNFVHSDGTHVNFFSYIFQILAGY